MKRVFTTAAGFLGGAIAGYVLAFAAYLVVTTIGSGIDREGAIAMAFAFFIGPVVALICGVGAAIWTARRV